MKKFAIVMIVLSVLFSASVAAKRGTNSLVVSGQGAVATVPDAFSVSFVIETRGQEVSALSAQVNDTLSSVVGFLLASGIDDDNIASMAVSLQPWYEHTKEGREHKGFVLTRTVNVLSDDIQAYDKILDGVMSRGVKRIERFEFVHSDPQGAYESALTLAIKDAKQRAKRIANELDVDIEGVIEVIENRSNGAIAQVKAMRVSEESFMSLPGSDNITASVSVTFAIED